MLPDLTNVINGIQQPYTYNQWRFAWLLLHILLLYILYQIICMIAHKLGFQTSSHTNYAPPYNNYDWDDLPENVKRNTIICFILSISVYIYYSNF